MTATVKLVKKFPSFPSKFKSAKLAFGTQSTDILFWEHSFIASHPCHAILGTWNRWPALWPFVAIATLPVHVSSCKPRSQVLPCSVLSPRISVFSLYAVCQKVVSPRSALQLLTIAPQTEPCCPHRQEPLPLIKGPLPFIDPLFTPFGTLVV